MRPTILTRRKIEYLFNHILDGFKSTTEGIEFIYKEGIISKEEYVDLLRQNADKLIARIHDFKITHKLVSISFAFLFTWFQVNGDDLDMRRSSRTRTRRRNETETVKKV